MLRPCSPDQGGDHFQYCGGSTEREGSRGGGGRGQGGGRQREAVGEKEAEGGRGGGEGERGRRQRRRKRGGRKTTFMHTQFRSGHVII